MATPPLRWKVHTPGCDCPCEPGQNYCFWPCCIWGMQASIDVSADDLVTGGRGVFACTVARVRVYSPAGVPLDSLDHSSHELTQADSPNFTRFWWGGGARMYRFGLNFPSTYLLCERADEAPNVQLVLRFTNVTPAENRARLNFSTPSLETWFSPDDSFIHPCLRGFPGSVGVWFNIGAICFGGTTWSDVDYLDSTEFVIDFGALTPTLVPHGCVDPPISAPVIRAPNTMPSLPADYQTEQGEICWTMLPCEPNDDPVSRINEWLPQNSCDDEECPPCICLNSTEEPCICGCTQATEPPLGLPSYLDLAKVAAPGANVENLSFEACISGFGVAGGAVICLVHAYGKANHAFWGDNAVPFEIWYSPGANRFVATLRGVGLNDNPARFDAYAPAGAGVVSCVWIPFSFTYDGVGAQLTVDGQAGIPAVAPPGWQGLSPWDAMYWGCYHRVQLGGINGQRVSNHSIK